jgi:hypothetical protein
LFRRALDPFHGTIETRYEPEGICCEICLDLPACGCAGANLRVSPSVPVMTRKQA